MTPIENLYEEYLAAVARAHRSGGMASAADLSAVGVAEDRICTMLDRALGRLVVGNTTWRLEEVVMDGTAKGVRLRFRYFVVITERFDEAPLAFTFPSSRPPPAVAVSSGV